MVGVVFSEQFEKYSKTHPAPTRAYEPMSGVHVLFCSWRYSFCKSPRGCSSASTRNHTALVCTPIVLVPRFAIDTYRPAKLYQVSIRGLHYGGSLSKPSAFAKLFQAETTVLLN